MTANQINYWRQREEMRHNVASEGETSRHNKETEKAAKSQINLGYAQLNETSRHNVASEQLSWANLNESKRHNVATETLTANNLQEAKRHNLVAEQQNAAAIAETGAHNRVSEAIAIGNAKLESDTKKYVADKSFQASKYATDVKRVSDKYATDKRAYIDYKTTEMTNANQSAIALSNNVTKIGTTTMEQVGKLGQSLLGIVDFF